MIGTGKAKRFVRARISRTETVISGLVLLLLIGIAIAVYVKGQSYDPGLFRLDVSALSKDRPARTQPESPVIQGEAPPAKAHQVAAGPETTPVRSPQMPAPAPKPSGLLDGLAPPGWKPLGAVTEFTADTLYEKIDGRAEQYLDFKFVQLTYASLVNQQDNSQFIDVYVFDMGRPVNAFGVYSVERSEGLPAVTLGREGYRAEASYFFWKGRYYCQVLASDKGAKLAEAGLNIAAALGKRLDDDGEPIWGLTALPEKDLIPGTVQYFVTDAMSLDFMKDTYLARYRKDGAELTVFLSKKTAADAAAKTLDSYEGYLKKFGKGVDKQEASGYTLLTGDMGGTFDAVFRKDTLIGGASMVPSRALAEKAALDLMAGLRNTD